MSKAESQERHGSKLNPYVGPRPFMREERDLFFGRNREAKEISSLIIASPVVLIYGQSGTGKTSLIQTQVSGQLEEREGCEVLLVRVGGSLDPEDFRAIPNIFIFNTISALREDDLLPGELDRLSLSEVLRNRARPIGVDGLPVLRILILDQFEEVFTSFPERWSERGGFFKQLNRAVAEDPLLRVVLSMREDYLAELDPYASLFWENLRARFRVERLRGRGALEAITKPLQARQSKGSGRSFADGVAETLVRSLLKVRLRENEFEGEFVDPVQLQVVCHTLWNHLEPSIDVITQEHVENFGDVGRALGGFYENTIRLAAENAQIGEGELRVWFARVLITPLGTRALVLRGSRETRRMPNAVVDELESAHLLRAEIRDGARWYELSHDRLIRSIQDSNARWLRTQSAAVQESQRLEDQAAEWERRGRDSSALLDSGELLHARRWLEGAQAHELAYSANLLDLVRASENAEAQRRLAKAPRRAKS